ncbi:MAG TPA: 3-deoxy-manno-octulosonate cytidylyltransferase, partial [Bacteroidota bacterium]|nr:3-deoxy-manno-octulosonate cytidylyltransferase [Bacteroidota bacterium]
IKAITDPQEITNPNIVKVVVDASMHALYFSRSPIPYVRDVDPQDDYSAWLRRTAFYKHFGIYVYTSECLRRFTRWNPGVLEQAEKLEQLRILEHGYKIKCALTTAESIAVDTQEDLERVRRAIAAQNRSR